MFIVDVAADFRKVSGRLARTAFRIRIAKRQAIEVNRLYRQTGREGNPE
jgi:hypothetical protein